MHTAVSFLLYKLFMIFSIITLFPEMFDGLFSSSILKRAQNRKIITIKFVNLRDFGQGKHKIVDDRPYGGGVGMVLKVDVMDCAIQAARIKNINECVILLDPKGEQFEQEHVEDLTEFDHIILICGHYEGVDERVSMLIDRRISLGNFVLTGGEIPAAAIIDAVSRHVKGVLHKAEAASNESFSRVNGKRLLEYSHYTRPAEYKGMKVPEILLSGNQKKISEFQHEEAITLSKKRKI